MTTGPQMLDGLPCNRARILVKGLTFGGPHIAEGMQDPEAILFFHKAGGQVRLGYHIALVHLGVAEIAGIEADTVASTLSLR
jgi:hypothetical protein